jgi:putative transposase
VLRLSKDTWYYAQKRRKYEDKYHFLRKPLFEIARIHPEYEYRRTTAELALEAWEKAKFMLKRFGQKIDGTIIHHDQDGVYIGYRWLPQVVVKDKVRISYSEDGAKGNVYSESFIGRFKSENRLLLWEQKDFEALEKVIKVRIKYYNRVRRHSALGNKSPFEYLNRKNQH